MTARLLIGDVHDRMAQLEPGSYDLIVTSPPFLALRSYLPDGHPLKAKEIGSEATPAAFLDVMLALTAEWGRLLAPHGSIAIEMGDTYSGSGGAGGDYDPDGLREGQPRFRQVRVSPDDPDRGANARSRGAIKADGTVRVSGGNGWPEAKSLAMIPELYAASLAYGRNLLRKPMAAREMLDYAEGWTLDHPDASAIDLLRMLRYWFDRYETCGPVIEYERWRVRNFKPWIRSNPPVGALGDKERPATSYITVATRAVDRYFDLDAVRTPAQGQGNVPTNGQKNAGDDRGDGKGSEGAHFNQRIDSNAAGAPPLDWVHTVDLIIDDEIDTRAGKTSGHGGSPAAPKRRANLTGGWAERGAEPHEGGTVGARGVHIRRRLETAGILTTVDALDVSPKGYKGAHYAVWPPELVKRLVLEMVPRRVCTTCGRPSRRIVGDTEYVKPGGRPHEFHGDGFETNESLANRRKVTGHDNRNMTAVRPTTGWSDCGHDTWRPGRILDPFAGSGTTLAVATGLGHDVDGIDIDERNADLATERCGMFLEVTHAGQIPGQQTIGGAA